MQQRPDLSPTAVTRHSSGASQIPRALACYFPASGFAIFFFFFFFVAMVCFLLV
jgi:hypothetical protein